MKSLIKIILIIIFVGTIVNGQDEIITGELSIWVENNPLYKFVSMTLELVSPACWDKDHYITELFNGGTEGDYINNGYLEFLCCWETYPNEYHRTFGLGLYKITAKVNGVAKDHFYIDYRTSDLPGAITGSCQIDYILDFNVGDEKFYYTNTQNDFSGYHAFWDLRPCVELITNDLEDYWENCLALIPSENNNPQLIWGHYPESVDLSGYNIYRKVGSGNFSLIHFNYESQLQYTDTDYSITEPTGTQLQYYVRATYVEERMSSPTNTVTTHGMTIEKSSYSNKSYNNGNRLFSNYPNPFNPTTTISFSLMENSYVTLRVFDIIGKEVAVLVNETLNAGDHKIVFDGTRFESGVYFYEIKAGNFTDVKKFILLK
jgi:hypothetical protein